ncbi:hypothetical protein ACRAWD_10205 [Caulobacter segnis]
MEYVTLDAEKQISSLVLTQAETFSLTVLPDRHVQRTPTPRADRKLRVLLTKAEIRNIVYSPLVFEDDQEVLAEAGASETDPILAETGVD